MNGMNGMKGWLGRTRRHTLRVTVPLFACAVLAAGAAGAEPPVREGPKPVRPGDHGIGRRIGDLTCTDLAGRSQTLAEIAPGKTTVFAMTSTSCPISRKYLPRLVELVETSGDGIAWVLVNPVATDKPADMQAAAARLGNRAIYVHDPDGRLAAAIGAVSTTDVVVLDRHRTIAYHGAIDDQHGFGYALEEPRKRFLADALAAIRAGEEPPVSATEAPGCVLDRPAAVAPVSDVTYHGRISRIIARHCVECHRDGGVGPFPLDSFAELVAHAPMVREVIDRGTMPPWFAAPTPADAETGRVHTPWANDRSLAERDKQDLLAWLAGSRPEGDPADAPEARAYPEGWQIGTPDAVFEFAEPVAVKATGVMPYQTVIVETHLPEDRWVQAIEVQPGDRDVVHHALIHLAGAEERAGDPRDAAAEERGGFWGEYVPGQNTLVYPPGFAKKLPKGARLKFQMHYTPNGTATADRTRVGVIYAKEPPRHEVRVAGIVNARISIPPGAADHREEAVLTLPHAATILGFLPHLHVRGKACRYDVVRAGGARTTLLDIPRYDFNWQLLYRLHEPLALEAGDRLVFTAWYDNSAGNPANPDPAKTVRWGPQTFDEMHLGYVEYFVPGVAAGEPSRGLRPRAGGRAGAARQRRGSDDVKAELDVPYAATDNPRQRLDLFVPARPAAGAPLPVVVFIHGGGWQNGDKAQGRAVVGRFAESGLCAAASIGYRLSGEAMWPAQIHDCKAAIRWLRAHAGEYGLDPDRIAVIGQSAGGHLAALLGTSGDVAALEGTLGDHAGAGSRVACVIDCYGPTDLLALGPRHAGSGSSPARLLGGPIAENERAAREASPITYVSADDPPFLFIHGTDDPVVPFGQSELLAATLAKAGVEALLVPVTGGGHGNFQTPAVMERIRAFLLRHLRGDDVSVSDAAIDGGGDRRD